MTTATPRTVSVVINTLDRCDRLERTLVGLRHQTHADYEVIVVNGPSSDGTDEMLRRRASSARLLRCDEKRLGVSRNIGATAAAGEIVAFIDDDALPEPDRLEHLLIPYGDPRVAAVGGPVYDVPLGFVDWQICSCTRLGAPNTKTPRPLDALLVPGADPFVYLAGCNMSFRRSALRSVGGFNSLFAYGYDDTELCRTLIDAGHKIEYSDDALVHHDRAPSAIRDQQSVIFDPYQLLFSRSVFALQNPHRSQSFEALLALVDEWRTEWHAYADDRLATGVFSDHVHRTFVDRADAAAGAAVEAGRQDRPFTDIGERPAGDFRPYR